MSRLALDRAPSLDAASAVSTGGASVREAREHPAMADLPRCYIASPLGFSEAGRHYHREVYLPALRTVVTPVDPWGLSAQAEIEAAATQGRQREMALEIGRRNAEAIDGCELLAAYLDGQEVDSGTAAEVGYAAARGLRCFGLRTDFREAGENGAVVNLQVEYFVASSGGLIATNLDELVAALAGHPSRPPSERSGRAGAGPMSAALS
jgi:nucleoside 2-deoxyribosyltransferase